jgi:hypothetical protein
VGSFGLRSATLSLCIERGFHGLPGCGSLTVRLPSLSLLRALGGVPSIIALDPLQSVTGISGVEVILDNAPRQLDSSRPVAGDCHTSLRGFGSHRLICEPACAPPGALRAKTGLRVWRLKAKTQQARAGLLGFHAQPEVR